MPSYNSNGGIWVQIPVTPPVEVKPEVKVDEVKKEVKVVKTESVKPLPNKKKKSK